MLVGISAGVRVSIVSLHRDSNSGSGINMNGSGIDMNGSGSGMNGSGSDWPDTVWLADCLGRSMLRARGPACRFPDSHGIEIRKPRPAAQYSVDVSCLIGPTRPEGLPADGMCVIVCVLHKWGGVTGTTAFPGVWAGDTRIQAMPPYRCARISAVAYPQILTLPPR